MHFFARRAAGAEQNLGPTPGTPLDKVIIRRYSWFVPAHRRLCSTVSEFANVLAPRSSDNQIRRMGNQDDRRQVFSVMRLTADPYDSAPSMLAYLAALAAVFALIALGLYRLVQPSVL